MYRRNDKPGHWATLAKLEGEKWTNLEVAPLWQGMNSGMREGGNGAQKLSALEFGYPSMKQPPYGNVLLLFWGQEECQTNVRWMRIKEQ